MPRSRARQRKQSLQAVAPGDSPTCSRRRLSQSRLICTPNRPQARRPACYRSALPSSTMIVFRQADLPHLSSAMNRLNLCLSTMIFLLWGSGAAASEPLNIVFILSPRKGSRSPGGGLVVRMSSIGGAENAACFSFHRGGSIQRAVNMMLCRPEDSSSVRLESQSDPTIPYTSPTMPMGGIMMDPSTGLIQYQGSRRSWSMPQRRLVNLLMGEISRLRPNSQT
jgi:hypothetical protein